MTNISKLAYVYDLNPRQGLGHFTRTNRLIKDLGEMESNAIWLWKINIEIFIRK